MLDRANCFSFTITYYAIIEHHNKYNSKLTFIFFFVWHFDVFWFLAAIDATLHATEVPYNQLPTDAAADEHVGVLGVELNAGHLNGGLEDVVERDDVRVTEVHEEHVRVEGLAHDLSAVVEGQVLNHRHTNQVRLTTTTNTL
jgi:hypothetical protein